MIKINLLSDKEKKERLTDEKVGTIVRLGFSVVFSLLILSLVMFSALIILDINLKSVKEESKTFPTGSARETQEAEELLKEVNEASQKIESNLKNIPFWGKIIRKISTICPVGVKIANIHIEKEHMRIIGFSKTREDFLAFQERLKNDDFKNFSSPVSNLVSPKDFSFTVEFDIDKNYLSVP
ncbi:MAG: hypothetical protein A3J76_03255 [Candidatus Moranbacteria bacterium RBG_13_45_13]|nr:MAG: hypothetical protein A3J76_03255 [Candidatus Moranbacteria bacterium RBG_13_45_13]